MAISAGPVYPLATFSIIARDEETGDTGIAVQTHQMGVGSLVPWLSPGVGGLATQAMINLAFGPMGLALLGEGVPASSVIDALVASDPQANFRQVGVVDSKGGVAAWTGENCISEAGHLAGEGYVAQANMMTNNTVVPAMANAYENGDGDLAARMMAALHAAQEEGGDIRGLQSAALKVVKGKTAGELGPAAWYPVYDLRVDEHEQPLLELDRLVRLRSAQLIDAQGYEALEEDQRQKGLALWHQARDQAPELEELGFWQAIKLADTYEDISTAAGILGPILKTDERGPYWIDLIKRLQTSGVIKRPGAGEELIDAIKTETIRYNGPA